MNSMMYTIAYPTDFPSTGAMVCDIHRCLLSADMCHVRFCMRKVAMNHQCDA